MEPPLGGPAQGAPGASPDSPARRRFLRFLGSFSIVSTISIIVAPIVGFLIPPKVQSSGGGGRVLAGTLADIPANTGLVVAMGSKPVIVTNTEAGIAAFSAVCTHLGCIVDFDTTVRQIVCPCHDGHFNAATGVVISGPPPRPLPPVASAIEGDQVFLIPGGG
jgi:nitrite reductase/ring-hydroxylating ferredoxin subunit